MRAMRYHHKKCHCVLVPRMLARDGIMKNLVIVIRISFKESLIVTHSHHLCCDVTFVLTKPAITSKFLN